VEWGPGDEPDPIDICVPVGDSSVLRYKCGRNRLSPPVMAPLP
jgi:hypothetical protein